MSQRVALARFAAHQRTQIACAASTRGFATPSSLHFGGLYVLYPHELKFASDTRRLYDRLAPDRDDPERLRLAFGLRDAREQNGTRVAQLLRCLSIAAGALVIQIGCWTSALALV